jgi:hypothetical protein
MPLRSRAKALFNFLKECRMKYFKIDSFDSVNDFLFEIYFRSEIRFDPAEDIRELKNFQAISLFTEDESNYLNEVMTECFIFCVLNDLNIDTMATTVQHNIHRLKSVA